MKKNLASSLVPSETTYGKSKLPFLEDSYENILTAEQLVGRRERRISKRSIATARKALEDSGITRNLLTTRLNNYKRILLLAGLPNEYRRMIIGIES
ncbi:hypothetical protein PR048_005217 [Dryococelus australis]|uniref:Uncharacterized protein n=1 Tax=Dryococelus australis TaxID=614101 RepID=A0ABQ9I7M2_9NEOP|nr:hypothetical protein PR048_005217 [Dryococelus australis]